MSIDQTEITESDFLHSVHEVIDRVSERQAGVIGYYVLGYPLHERQDEYIATHFGLSREISPNHVRLDGGFLLKRELSFSPGVLEAREDDSSVASGVTYYLQLPDIH
jgi:hypothetical protein